jgi:hypothetical protein
MLRRLRVSFDENDLDSVAELSGPAGGRRPAVRSA